MACEVEINENRSWSTVRHTFAISFSEQLVLLPSSSDEYEISKRTPAQVQKQVWVSEKGKELSFLWKKIVRLVRWQKKR